MPKKVGFLSELQPDLKMAFSEIRKTARYVIYAVIFIYFLSGIYVIGTNEVGILKHFGRVISKEIKPGIHYRLPWPVDEVDKVRIKEVKRMEVGFWIKKGQAEELKAAYGERGAVAVAIIAPYCLTGDKNIMHTRIALQYRVKDPVAFLYDMRNPEFLLKGVVQEAIIDSIVRMPVDEVLTIGKHRLQQEVHRKSQVGLDALGCGIQIDSVELKSAEPPEYVVAAFKDVINAQEGKTTLIHEAESYRNQIIPEAQAKASAMLQEAEAYKARKIAYAQGEAKRFSKMLAEYQKSQDVTKERLYIELLEEILPGMKKYIVSEEEGEDVVRLKFFSGQK
ncbi:MAG: FtsH protease activity modulator HflK [Nitrospirae bacterium]|nr:FtsH protease activity modulator HflK [Nitrospirota bacterium]